MPTITKRPLPARKSKAKTAGQTVPAWIGSGKGKASVRPGVDLTKPTLPPGKHL